MQAPLQREGMVHLHATVELSIGGSIIHTKIDTLRAGAKLSPIMQSIFAVASDQVEAVASTWCGEMPRVCLTIDRDCVGWRHVMNYLRAVELGYDNLGTIEMIGDVEFKERRAAVVEARWLGLSKLEDILTNLPDFTRQTIQARVSIANILQRNNSCEQQTGRVTVEAFFITRNALGAASTKQSS
jgi:hypothetical protein